jgi:NAD+ synthase (glutamine-hydrolysing)
MRVGIAQINSTVGDLSGNTGKIIESIDQAKSLGVDLLTFPELAITGYPPEDLLLKPQFIRQNKECLDKIIEHSSGIAVVGGFVDSDGDIYNAAAVIYDKKLAGVYHKIYLPNYGVFDENRYFRAGTKYPIFNIYGVGIGINICEDIWY